MSCLLPPFKSPPDLLPPLTKSYLHSPATNQSRCRDPGRTHCLLSTSSASAIVDDVEKLRLRTLEECSNSNSMLRPCLYARRSNLSPEEKLGRTLAVEAYITSEEAVIAAAAAEAIALARSAAKVARDAALMAGNYQSTRSAKIPTSDSESIQSKRTQLIETERGSDVGHSMPAEIGMREDHSTNSLLQEVDGSEATFEEIKQLQHEFSRSIAVRSERQTQRKTRRAKATEKAVASSPVSAKSGSTSHKKCAAVTEVAYADPLRYLRGTTGTARLLTAKQERELSTAIQDLLKLEKLREDLAKRTGVQPSFREWAAAAGVDKKTLTSRVNHGIRCKDKMINSNIRLVISIAKNYQGAGMNLQDLVQEGCRGLVRGAEKFDATKGFKFSTYAHWWIKQAIRKSLSDQSRTIRLPFHIVEATYRVKEARKQLYSKNGKWPSNEEVAEATGLSMKRLMAVLQTPKPPKSLDQKVGTLDLKPSEIISDPEAETTQEVLTKQCMKQDLDKVLNTLTPREKQVLRWRYGVEDGRTKTLQEIGELMAVSRERIRQIETVAFHKLQNKKRIEALQQYFPS